MSEWISVKDRLPEINQNVLCFDANRVLFATDWLDWPDGTVSFYVPTFERHIWCTHWMPLPEPPEEEQNVEL